jgi:DNA-directed RNA polymerase I, II, and III subunit RPABC2
MSDNEYLSEEEEDEEEEEEEDEDEEENESPLIAHNNKGSKPLTPLTFGRTFTNQHRIKSTDGEIEAEEDEDEDEEEEEDGDEDGIAGEDDEDAEEEDDEIEEDSTSKSGGGGKGKRKRSKKRQGSDTDSEDDGQKHPTEEDRNDMQEGEDEDSVDDEDEGEAERYMHQFEKDLTKEYILETHPECIPVNMAEVRAMLPVIRNTDGMIVDDFHRTLPIVTKYEKARIIGQRAMQLNAGATPYIPVENLIDGTTIAEMEFEQKKIPVIIKRPLPNGAFEYWRLKDLEILY